VGKWSPIDTPLLDVVITSKRQECVGLLGWLSWHLWHRWFWKPPRVHNWLDGVGEISGKYYKAMIRAIESGEISDDDPSSGERWQQKYLETEFENEKPI
jgi:hypothetical protein